MDPTQILNVEAAVRQINAVEVACDAFAAAMFVALKQDDPMLSRGGYDAIRAEVGYAATDIGQMMLGIPDIAEWGEGVSR